MRIPVRLVRDRVAYEDLARAPFVPANPDRHHRDETLSGLADPELYLQAGGPVGHWSVAGKAGVSIPLGRTEPNPFELGRLGIEHQHIQFGTGTWVPILELGVGRPVGGIDFRLTGITHLSLGENEHGYQAGNRHALLLDASYWPGERWGLETGLALAREEGETWSGRVEEEGNLGRTDVFLKLGATRAATALGSIHAELQIPIHSHAREHQTEIPVIARLTWAP